MAISTYELGFSLNYVRNWNYIDAIREIFQNALDEEIQNNENKMYFNYDENQQAIEIGNKNSILEVKSLLLGVSSKQHDENTIGQFGEGYKLAIMVLMREKKNVVIYNYSKREIWKSKIVNSRRYGCQVVQIDIEDTPIWKNVPNNNLTIRIENISLEEFNLIKEKNLHLFGCYRKFDTPKGEILLEDKLKGQIFVKGLYVCSYDKYQYGYNFNPNQLELDRDRKLVSDSIISQLASRMWNDIGDDSDEIAEIICDMLKNNSEDIKYTSYISKKDISKKVVEKAYDEFRKHNGKNSVPITYSWDSEEIPSTYKTVSVPESLKLVIKLDDRYENPKKQMILREEDDDLEILNEWFLKIKHKLGEHEIERFEEIYYNLVSKSEFDNTRIVI